MTATGAPYDEFQGKADRSEASESSLYSSEADERTRTADPFLTRRD